MKKQGYYFKDMLDIGYQGFEEVQDMLNRMNITVGIDDLQEDKYYQEKDIDFLWKYINNGLQQKYCELKTDTIAHKTGNIFIELVSNTRKNTKGNFLYTQCDLFMYYLINSKKLFIFDMNKLKTYVGKNINNFAIKKTQSNITENMSYNTLGITIPIRILTNELKNNMIIFQN